MKRLLPFLGAAGVLAWLVSIYLFDPEQGRHYLPCPFRWLTGWLCPGCGSQRAMHDLFHGRLCEALGHNAALVCCIPLLGAQWAVGRWRGLSLGTDNRVVYGWAIALVAWGIVRNLPGLEVLAR
ncbi:MAG: DUF2752 domain-containing protein [Flavobacteriales bacterium]|nr:DUF2752 domain-containing protein [Flavobacteriales bacterium]